MSIFAATATASGCRYVAFPAAAAGTRQIVDATVRRLLDTCGRTYAEEAGIRLADKPVPLYRLLVLATLVSAPMKAAISVNAARELVAFGLGSPDTMRDASWEKRVEVLDRGHYARYDESTATALGDGARLVLDVYHGDLRRMRAAAGGDLDELRRRLREFPRIGPLGADVFCREAQAVWPELRPYLDRRALDGAARIGLPRDAAKLAATVPGDDLARLAAALVRVSLSRELAEAVRRPEQARTGR